MKEKKTKHKSKVKSPSSNLLQVPNNDLHLDHNEGDKTENLTEDEKPKSRKKSLTDEDVEHLRGMLIDLEDLKIETEEQREIIEEQDVIINQLGKQASNLENVCGQPCQQIWKITGFKKHLQQAKTDKESVLFSRPFYTHNKGYKIGLSLCMNGDGAGEGTHMSIFFCLLWSSFDALLSWPYCLPIEFSLLDQQEDVKKRKNLVTQFIPNPVKENLPYLGRPQDYKNPSVGLPLFVAHADMFTGKGKYVIDDTIYIQVKVDLTEVIGL